jgi:dCMP deaminase
MRTNRPTARDYFLGLLDAAASRSTCRRRAVAAILVDKDNHVLSIGYNGVPRRLPHCLSHPCPGAEDPSGNSVRCEAVHAEVNAVLQCARVDLIHTAYVSCTPCFNCAKMLANIENLQRIICLEEYSDLNGYRMLGKAGIEVVVERRKS